MQTLLAILSLAQTTPNGNPVNAFMEQLRQQSPMDAWTAMLLFLAGQVILIIAILIASKAVVTERHRGTLRNALRVWFMQWLIGILAIVICFVIVFVLSASKAFEFAGIAFLIIAVVSFILSIRVTMSVYGIGFFRAIGLMIIASVVSIIGTTAAGFFIGPPPQKQLAQFQQWKERLEQKYSASGGQLLPGEKIARDASKPLSEREEGLKTMYAELERRRHAVPPGDEAARLAYERQRARYEALLDQMKAEAKSQQSTGKTP